MALPSKTDIEKIKQKVAAIRASEGKKHDSEYCASLAREYIALNFLKPLILREFPGIVSTILLTGSAQPHVRKASLQRPKSDLDLIVVFAKSDPGIGLMQTGFRLAEESRFLESIAAKAKQVFGFEVNFQPHTVASFISYYSNIGRNFPHHPIYGAKLANELKTRLAPGWKKAMEEKRLAMRSKPKYRLTGRKFQK